MATRAVSQKRNCLLINFSTSIETLDLSGKIGIAKAIEFLQRSFHGGTDASPAFEYALEMMSEEKYKQSDLLIISDFIMDSLSESLQEKISTVKKDKNHFYSLSIGDLFLSKKLHDNFVHSLSRICFRERNTEGRLRLSAIVPRCQNPYRPVRRFALSRDGRRTRAAGWRRGGCGRCLGCF